MEEIKQVLHKHNDEELDYIYNLITDEVNAAEKKHPNWPKDIVHSVAVMAEESGEATQKSLDYYWSDGSLLELEEEIIQTAAMAIRCMIYIKRYEK